MDVFNDIAKDIIKDLILTTMPKIDVISGSCRYNFKCQMNSVHEALNNSQDKIAMCFYIDDGEPIIHFININEDGTYIDNTLGRWSEIFDYYLIKTIDKEDFFKINTIFTAYRKELKTKLPFYVRWFANCNF